MIAFHKFAVNMAGTVSLRSDIFSTPSNSFSCWLIANKSATKNRPNAYNLSIACKGNCSGVKVYICGDEKEDEEFRLKTKYSRSKWDKTRGITLGEVEIKNGKQEIGHRLQMSHVGIIIISATTDLSLSQISLSKSISYIDNLPFWVENTISKNGCQLTIRSVPFLTGSIPAIYTATVISEDTVLADNIIISPFGRTTVAIPKLHSCVIISRSGSIIESKMPTEDLSFSSGTDRLSCHKDVLEHFCKPLFEIVKDTKEIQVANMTFVRAIVGYCYGTAIPSAVLMDKDFKILCNKWNLPFFFTVLVGENNSNSRKRKLVF